MRKALLATAAVLLALGGPAFAQDQPAAENAPEAAPDPETAGSTTGGVTAHARENLPDVGDGDVMDAEALPQAEPASGEAGSGVVSEQMVKELYQMALEQQHKAAKADEPVSEEAKQATQKAIAAHREGVFARVEARS